MARRLCAVSVDLDALDLYARIHGLDLPLRVPEPVLTAALPRFLKLFATQGVPGTFFVVGQDACTPTGREALAGLVAAGHEVASHSHSHPYDLFRRDPAVMAAELESAHESIQETCGVAPRGFRAPGYGLSPALLDAVAAMGYCYDSSILPSPPYYGAKAAVMGGLVLRGQPSGSALADPRLTLAPTAPYRPDPAAPWRRGHGPVVELPMAVVPGLRVPVIGTTLALAPEPVRRLLVRFLTLAPVINLELHGIDLLDAELDEIEPELVRRQPDLRVPVSHKRAALAATCAEIAAAGYAFVPVVELAQAVAAS